MQALRIRVMRVALASAMLLGADAHAEAQQAEARRGTTQRREMSVALEPVRAPLLLRIAAGGLLLIVVLGAIGRRRARSEVAAGDPSGRDGAT